MVAWYPDAITLNMGITMEEEKRPQRHATTLRLPPELVNKIKAVAEMNRRTLTKEIEFALEQYIIKHEKESNT